jgi:hypothetical protein
VLTTFESGLLEQGSFRQPTGRTNSLLATFEAELLESWLLTELSDAREPPESVLTEATELAGLLGLLTWTLDEVVVTLVELVLPELDPLVPDVRCAKRVTETNRAAAMTRPENRIKHLPIF